MTGEHCRPCRLPASVQRAGVYWVLVPDEPVEVAVVNATGHRVFQLCDGSRSVASIAQEIADETSADVEAVTTDVTRYVAKLEQAGLLRSENDERK